MDVPLKVAGWTWDPAADEVAVTGPVTGLTTLPVPAAIDDLVGLVAPAHRGPVTAALRGAAGDGAGDGDSDSGFAIEFTTAGAEPTTLRMLGRPVVVDGHRRLVGMVEDVTADRAHEQHRVRASRRAGMAKLAAGVAHDLNNFLTVISMRADLLDGALEAEAVDPVHYQEDLSAISAASVGASGLTRQLSVFAGSGGGPTAEVDLAALVAGLRPRLAEARGGPVDVDYDLQECPAVRCDRAQAEQLVSNLVVNARDAVAEAVALDRREPRVRVTVRPVTDAVLIEVTDNGAGMSDDVAERALDPFFTTRGAGRGTGLGLSVVFGIVEHLGGTLDLESEPGVGTTVRVTLPTVAGAAARPVPPEAAEAATRVLVVDDDPAVVAITARILGSRGFDVTTASSGEQALALLHGARPFAIVVSDVVMGQMTGMVLAEHIARDWPGLPTLLVTGYAPPAGLVVNPLLDLVTKPLTGAQLVGAVRTLLDRAATRGEAAPSPA